MYVVRLQVVASSSNLCIAFPKKVHIICYKKSIAIQYFPHTQNFLASSYFLVLRMTRTDVGKIRSYSLQVGPKRTSPSSSQLLFSVGLVQFWCSILEIRPILMFYTGDTGRTIRWPTSWLLVSCRACFGATLSSCIEYAWHLPHPANHS